MMVLAFKVEEEEIGLKKMGWRREIVFNSICNSALFLKISKTDKMLTL